eukprot:gene5743-4104_t
MMTIMIIQFIIKFIQFIIIRFRDATMGISPDKAVVSVNASELTRIIAEVAQTEGKKKEKGTQSTYHKMYPPCCWYCCVSSIYIFVIPLLLPDPKGAKRISTELPIKRMGQRHNMEGEGRERGAQDIVRVAVLHLLQPPQQQIGTQARERAFPTTEREKVKPTGEYIYIYRERERVSSCSCCCFQVCWFGFLFPLSLSIALGADPIEDLFNNLIIYHLVKYGLCQGRYGSLFCMSSFVFCCFFLGGDGVYILCVCMCVCGFVILLGSFCLLGIRCAALAPPQPFRRSLVSYGGIYFIDSYRYRIVPIVETGGDSGVLFFVIAVAVRKRHLVVVHFMFAPLGGKHAIATLLNSSLLSPGLEVYRTETLIYMYGLLLAPIMPLAWEDIKPITGVRRDGPPSPFHSLTSPQMGKEWKRETLRINLPPYLYCTTLTPLQLLRSKKSTPMPMSSLHTSSLSMRWCRVGGTGSQQRRCVGSPTPPSTFARRPPARATQVRVRGAVAVAAVAAYRVCLRCATTTAPSPPPPPPPPHQASALRTDPLPLPPYPLPAAHVQQRATLETLGCYQASWLRPRSNAVKPRATAAEGGEPQNRSPSSSSLPAEGGMPTEARGAGAGAAPSSSASILSARRGPPRSVQDWYPLLAKDLYYLPQYSDLMAAPPHQALEEYAKARPYHDILQLVAEQGQQLLSFLLEFAVASCDAPLPHVVYQDLMKVSTFSSHQLPPEEQFQLPSRLRLMLLSTAARVCLMDRHYVHQAQALFRRMEQQQSLRATDYSALVWICAAGDAIQSAFDTLVWMCSSGHRLRFCPVVFSLLMHPSVDLVAAQFGGQPHVLKGLMLQQRLAKAWADEAQYTSPLNEEQASRAPAMALEGVSSGGEKGTLRSRRPPSPVQSHHNCFAMGVHAVFVHQVLTFKHEARWEWLGLALEKEAQNATSSFYTSWRHAAGVEAGRAAAARHGDRIGGTAVHRLQPRVETSMDAVQEEEEEAGGVYAAEDLVARHRPSASPRQAVVEPAFRVADRTLRLALEVFAAEKGARCPPTTVKLLFLSLVDRGEALFGPSVGGATAATSVEVSLPSALLFLLMRTRRNEIAASTGRGAAAAPLLSFTEEEVELCTMRLRQQHAATRRRARAVRSPTAAETDGIPTPPQEEDEDEEVVGDRRYALVMPLLQGLMRSPPPAPPSCCVKEEEGKGKGKGAPSDEARGGPFRAGEISAVERHRPAGDLAAGQDAPLQCWKTLLQHCATFGREILSSPSQPPPPAAAAEQPPQLSATARAYAKVLFTELKALDSVTTAAVEQQQQQQQHPFPSEANDLAPDAVDAVGERELQVLQALEKLRREGATASQQYFTQRVLEAEQEEAQLRKALETAWWSLEEALSLWMFCLICVVGRDKLGFGCLLLLKFVCSLNAQLCVGAYAYMRLSLPISLAA